MAVCFLERSVLSPPLLFLDACRGGGGQDCHAAAVDEAEQILMVKSSPGPQPPRYSESSLRMCPKEALGPISPPQDSRFSWQQSFHPPLPHTTTMHTTAQDTTTSSRPGRSTPATTSTTTSSTTITNRVLMGPPSPPRISSTRPTDTHVDDGPRSSRQDGRTRNQPRTTSATKNPILSFSSWEEVLLLRDTRTPLSGDAIHGTASSSSAATTSTHLTPSSTEPIPIPGTSSSSMTRTYSELQLLADEAMAEYRDRRMYSRIVDGMMKNQYRSAPTTTSDSTIDTIRHIMETRHQPFAQNEQQEFAPSLRKRIGYFSDKSPISEKENRTTAAGSTTTSTTAIVRPRLLRVSGSSWQDWPSSPPPQEGSSSTTTSTTTGSPQPQAVDDPGLLGVSSLYYYYDNAASQRTTMLVRDEPKKMANTLTTISSGMILQCHHQQEELRAPAPPQQDEFDILFEPRHFDTYDDALFEMDDI